MTIATGIERTNRWIETERIHIYDLLVENVPQGVFIFPVVSPSKSYEG